MANYEQKLDEGLLFRVEEFVRNSQARYGSSPTRREIADACGVNVKRAHKYVHALADKGRIEIDVDGEIAVPENLDSSDVRNIPLIGAVRCGNPSLAVEEYEGMFRLPRAFTGDGDFFMLEAKGDSMTGANIFEGDYLVIRRQSYADSGDIVVACCESEFSSEEEATLKCYVVKDGNPILRPENDEYDDIDAKEFRIIGKLKCIIRDMEVVAKN